MLRYLDGTTQSEAAAALDCSVGTGQRPRQAVRLVFTVVPPQGARTSIQVRPVTVGGQKLFAFAVPGSPKQLRLSWKAYDSSGAVIASSMASVAGERGGR